MNRASRLIARALRRTEDPLGPALVGDLRRDTGAAGEGGEAHLVANKLAKLRRHGWYTLDTVRLASNADVDHLVIGPGGVFAVKTRHHPMAQIRVDRQMVTVDGAQQPYIPASRNDASTIIGLLSAGCGFPVHVRSVLAFVGASQVRSNRSPADILVLHGGLIDRALKRLPSVLNASTAGRIYAVARREQLWLAG